MIPNEKAQSIRALVCGVDGVLTDGTIGYGSDRGEFHFFNTYDGLAIHLAEWFGLKVAWMTGRLSNPITRRARDLDVPVYSGFINKEEGLKIVARDMGVQLHEIAYVGDDLNDLLAFRVAGFPIAVANAAEAVRARAAYVTVTPGGKGAIREVVEAILMGQRNWDAAVENYLDALRDPERVRRFPRTAE